MSTHLFIPGPFTIWEVKETANRKEPREMGKKYTPLTAAVPLLFPERGDEQ